MDKRAILSVDGGGIRGIIPASALVKLEEVTGKLTREVFGFAAGTSTGGLIAAAVAAGIPATQIRDLYVTLAKEIFPSRPFNLVRRIVNGSMYSTTRLGRLIADALGEAQAWSLNDAPIDLLLTAKRVPDGKPWYFVKDNPKNSGCTGTLNMVDCATASAAAPTYFAPFRMPEPPDRPPGCQPIGTLVDGGVGVTGNPVYQACIEAFDYDEGYEPERTLVVSLGTGHYTQRRMPSWIYPWLNWVLAELLDSPEEQQTQITRRLYPMMRFYRLDIELESDIPMDDARGVPELLRYGEELAGRIDWKAILSGSDTRFLVAAKKSARRR